jgi:predicted homoserine dehydrogenase-like protein
LARRAQEAGVVYSLAWGDQPALICEHVDWARACGFKVIAAGKGTRYEPHYHASTPATVWEILDRYLKIDDRNSINPKMFNSFIDGTKSGIEMTAVCNATGLKPQSGGLKFPPASRFELADVCKPRRDGGALEDEGVTEVVSSVTRDGRDVPHHLAMGTYVVFEGESDYARRCFREYHLLPDASRRYAALYRPVHMIGLELGISVASVALRHEPTGAPSGFRSDVVATAKRALKAGEMLDGEGGYAVWANAIPAKKSLAVGGLPIGLAHNVKLKRPVAKDTAVTYDDVELVNDMDVVGLRREMEGTVPRATRAAA